jgi:hypothetical protein
MPRVTGEPLAGDSSGEQDELALAHYATALQTAIAASLRPWIESLIQARAPDLSAQVPGVADAVAASALPQMQSLLQTDVDEQRTTPLQVLRSSMGPVTGLLSSAGVPRPDRDAQARRIDPNDLYDLGPVSFADLGEAVGDAGLTWGAAKAHVHLSRRRALD